MMSQTKGNFYFAVVVPLFQLLLFIFYIVFTEYNNNLGEGGVQDAQCQNLFTEAACRNATGCLYNSNSDQCLAEDGGVDAFYPFFQDVHAMIFIGFGFLMTFLARYGFSAVGINFLLACLALQWATFTNQFWHRVLHDGWDELIKLDIVKLITGDFAAGAVLITFGAVLGKTTPLQLVCVVFFELIFYSLNESIGVIEYEAVDMGGSMFVHMFGAYFGLALSFMLGRYVKNQDRTYESKNQTSTATTDLFAMIGTLVLWIFWPSFNGALATGASQHRVVINTVLSLSAACVMAFSASAMLRPGFKFSMVDIQNATLAGGVAVGSSSDLVIDPWGAILIGSVAGTLSVIGYVYITPMLEKYVGIHDTCGVNNLHGMPGILGAIGGAISAALTDETEYGEAIGNIFPARGGDDPRSAAAQGAYQIYAMLTTLGIAIVGGLFTGAIVGMMQHPTEFFSDEENWLLEEGEEHDDVHEAASKTQVMEMNGQGLNNITSV